MRSLVWVTTLTLVASAIATVACVDYGARHPETALGQTLGRLRGAPAAPATPDAKEEVGLEKTA